MPSDEVHTCLRRDDVEQTIAGRDDKLILRITRALHFHISHAVLLADIRHGCDQIALFLTIHSVPNIEVRIPIVVLHRLVFDVSQRSRHAHHAHHSSVRDLPTPHAAPLPPPSHLQHTLHLCLVVGVVAHRQLHARPVATQHGPRVAAVHAVDRLLVLGATLNPLSRPYLIRITLFDVHPL